MVASSNPPSPHTRLISPRNSRVGGEKAHLVSSLFRITYTRTPNQGLGSMFIMKADGRIRNLTAVWPSKSRVDRHSGRCVLSIVHSSIRHRRDVKVVGILPLFPTTFGVVMTSSIHRPYQCCDSSPCLVQLSRQAPFQALKQFRFIVPHVQVQVKVRYHPTDLHGKTRCHNKCNMCIESGTGLMRQHAWIVLSERTGIPCESIATLPQYVRLFRNSE